VFPHFIHNSIKGLLALSLVFSLFVFEKTNYPIVSESIYSEWVLDSRVASTYQSVFAFSVEKIPFTSQSIDKALLYIQASIVKLTLKLSEKLSLYTIFIHKKSNFPIHVSSFEVPYLKISQIMEKWKRYLRYAGLALLILLSFAGIALPVSMNEDPRREKVKIEEAIKKEEEEDDLLNIE